MSRGWNDERAPSSPIHPSPLLGGRLGGGWDAASRRQPSFAHHPNVRPTPTRHLCAPFPSFLRRQEPAHPNVIPAPPLPSFLRRQEPRAAPPLHPGPPAAAQTTARWSPGSCLRRNDIGRQEGRDPPRPNRATIPPEERKCDAMPSSPGAPNKPEQTRTNPNTAGRLDQIGKPPATPLNTPKKTTLNITRERSQPPTPHLTSPLGGGRDELRESVEAGLGAEHRGPTTAAHTERPRTNLNKPEQTRTNPNSAERPDQIGRPSKTPPNAPKKNNPEQRPLGARGGPGEPESG